MKLIVLLCAVTIPALPAFGQLPERDARQNWASSGVRVEGYFREFYRSRKPSDEGTRLFEFPKRLSWQDIPNLLKHSRETRMLDRWIINPISSQMQSSCSEGMMALWLVEGIRKGSKFASLNPLCFSRLPRGGRGGTWEEASEANHMAVADAYQAWWDKVKGLSIKAAEKISPLAGTPLRWH